MRRAVVRSDANRGEASRDQIVHEGESLRRDLRGALGQEEVVVHQRRPMADLNEDILPKSAHLLLIQLAVHGQRVVMEQVSGHPGSLRLPVEPDAAGAVMNMVVPEHHVDRRMHLDAADLRAGKILPDVDPVDVVILNPGEHAAHVPDNAGLSAVMNFAAADDMMPDILFCPAVV